MAQNKNALIRYKTIDKCLQNRYKKWTLDDLIHACSEALYDYEGRDINVSKRSVQLDIQLMRSDKLGYNAPIIVYDKKYYKYEDDSYSITDIPLTENDMNVLSETVEMLKQFKDFSLFSELNGIIHKLEDKIYTEKNNQASIIHLDKNENLKGLEYLDILYQAILKEVCLTLTYRSFKAKKASEIVFHPFILKQFNNRWFIIGKSKRKGPIMNLALDRIIQIDYNLDVDYLKEHFDGDEYFKNTYGVTVLNDEQLQEVDLKLDARNAPYVITKPFHSSQKTLQINDDGSAIIRVKVHLNFEFERLILGFGNTIQVLKPGTFRRRIQNKLKDALELYT
ncbi:WYL domain-containing protein [bacterium SCSIO 12643]|nr:WYL domain-containing protein [bacterium SCSIO 12643]